jgi:hypothetical protein
VLTFEFVICCAEVRVYLSGVTGNSVARKCLYASYKSYMSHMI